MDEHLFGWVLDHCFYHSILWFLSDELWKLKTHFRCFQFLKLSFQWHFRNYTHIPNRNVWQTDFFFFGWNPAATFEIENLVWVRASPMVQNTLYNRECEQKKGLQQPLYTSIFFLLMNSSSSGLMGYCSFFKSFFSIIIIRRWIKKCWKMCSC